MLRLNSQYAKSYLREQRTNSALEEPQKQTYRCESRRFYIPEPNAYVEQLKGHESQFQADLCRNRKDNRVLKKTRCYNQNDENTDYSYERWGKNRSIYPQENDDFSAFKKSPRLLGEENDPRKENHRALNNIDQNTDFSMRGKYQIYGKHNSSFRESFGEKKEFVAKHNKRNEEIKNRIYREDPRNNQIYDEFVLNSFQKDQDFQPEKLTKRDIYRENREKPQRNASNEEFYQGKNPKYSRKPFSNQQYQVDDPRQNPNSRQSFYKTSQSFQRQPHKYEKGNPSSTNPYPTRSIEIEYNQRKNSYSSYKKTPSRLNQSTAFQPGSAEKKRSLIQKSQMLQQKLKKLTSTPINSGKPQKIQKFETEQALSYRESKNYRNQNYFSNAQNNNLQLSKYSSNHNSEQIQQVQAAKNVERSRTGKNSEVLRTPSPLLQSKASGNQGEAIQRIMELNEKINQRIQSIISNYSKK